MWLSDSFCCKRSNFNYFTSCRIGFSQFQLTYRKIPKTCMSIGYCILFYFMVIPWMFYCSSVIALLLHQAESQVAATVCSPPLSLISILNNSSFCCGSGLSSQHYPNLPPVRTLIPAFPQSDPQVVWTLLVGSLTTTVQQLQSMPAIYIASLPGLVFGVSPPISISSRTIGIPAHCWSPLPLNAMINE